MLSDTAIGYICTTVGALGVCGVIAFIAYLSYLHDSKVEDNERYSKKDIYE